MVNRNLAFEAEKAHHQPQVENVTVHPACFLYCFSEPLIYVIIVAFSSGIAKKNILETEQQNNIFYEFLPLPYQKPQQVATDCNTGGK